MLLSKLFSKYSNDTKVKADKFVNKLEHVESVASKQPPKAVVSSLPNKPFNNEINKPQTREPINNQSDNDFSNLFSNNRKSVSEEEIKNGIITYCREVIEPVIKQIKDELAKHQREVRVNLNTILLLGSASVFYRGRAEYDYVIQIKPGKTKENSTLVVKGTGERGGFDIRKSLSGLTIEEVKKEEYLKDFLNGYKGFMVARGWM